MWLMASLVAWASDPVLQSPESRLPVGAIARVGDARMTRPLRSAEIHFITPDGRFVVISTFSNNANRPPVEWWDLQSFRRVPPPFRLRADERIVAITAAGITTMSDRGYELRDPASGAVRFRLPPNEELPSHLMPNFATDGTLAIARSYEGKVILFRKAADGSCVATVLKDMIISDIWSMAASGKAFVWHDETDVKRYDTATGAIRTVAKLTELLNVVASLDISPDGERICLVKRDRNYDMPAEAAIYVGDDPKPIPLAEPMNANEPFQRVRFTGDGRTLVNLNAYRGSYGWSSVTGESVWFSKSEHVSRMTIGHDGSRILMVDSNGSLRLVDPRRGAELTPAVPRFGEFDLVRWVGPNLAIGTVRGEVDAGTVEVPGKIYRWDPMTGTPPTVVRLDPKTSWSVEAIAADGQTVALSRAVSDKIHFQIRPLEGGGPIAEWAESTADSPFVGPWTPDGRRLIARRDLQTALFTGDGQRPIVTFQSGKLPRRNADEGWGPRRVAVSPDQRLVYSIPSSYQLAAFELATGQPRFTVTIPGSDTRRNYGPSGFGLALAGNGRRLVVENQGQVTAIDATTGRIDRHFDIPSRRRSSESPPIALSHTGRWLATVRADVNDIAIFDLEADRIEPTTTFRGATGTIAGLAFRPDDAALLSVSTDGTAVTWDTSKLKPIDDRHHASPEQWWADLAGDGLRAGTAMAARQRSAPAETIAVLRAKWAVPVGLDPGELARAVADLDAGDFRVRQAAQQLLRHHIEQAEASLRPLANSARSAEVRMQARMLLDDLDGPDRNADRVRWGRAIELLERLATPEAVAELKRIAAGPVYLRTTREAKAAMGRLTKRH
jgi:WD40 repeat protein